MTLIGNAVATRQPDRHVRAGLEDEACKRFGSDREVPYMGREQPRRGDAAGLESLGHPATSVGGLRSHAAFEAHQPVVGGVLVRLAPCGNCEGRVDEAVDRTTLVHHKLPNMD